MTSPIVQKHYPILSNIAVADGYFELTVAAENFGARPAQFVNIKVGDDYAFLLRKPFSVYQQNDERFSVLYKVMGRGTARLSRYQAGESIDILGPLGQAFEVLPGKRVALLAGGVGIASLRLIADSLQVQNIPFDLFYGVRSQAEVVDHETWITLAKRIFFSSDDGSVGKSGFVTDLFATQIQSYDLVIACGPHPMLRSLRRVCDGKITDYLIMEEYMACGFGICMGCVVQTQNGYEKICTKGPVFKGEDLVWST